MQCTKCGKPAIMSQRYSGRNLCRVHFLSDVEAKAKRDIRAHRWLLPGDHIGVVMTGMAGDLAALYLLKKIIGLRRDIRLSAVIVTGGAVSAGSPECSLQYALSLKIPCCEGFFRDEAAPGHPGCGGDRFLRDLVIFGQAAKKSGLTRLAAGWCLDDEAALVLGCMLQGDAETIIRGQSPVLKTLPIISPFISVPAEEVMLDVHAMLAEYTVPHPATPYALAGLGKALAAAAGAAAASSGTGDDDRGLQHGDTCGSTTRSEVKHLAP
jgi:hypothetical protein